MRKILVEKRELLVENELMVIIVLPYGQILQGDNYVENILPCPYS